MDREMELAHLAIADKAVENGERHIALEEQRISKLDRDGHDTKLALATLATFRKLQAEHVAHRDMILKIIKREAETPHSLEGPIFQPGHYESIPKTKRG